MMKTQAANERSDFRRTAWDTAETRMAGHTTRFTIYNTIRHGLPCHEVTGRSFIAGGTLPRNVTRGFSEGVGC